MSFWSGTRVLVTGRSGFVGSQVVAKLQALCPAQVCAPRREDYDLVSGADSRRLLADARPDFVIHLAARVCGIGANRASPGLFFYENLMMGVQLLEESHRCGVEKFVAVGTVCAYPKYTPVPSLRRALKRRRGVECGYCF